MHCPYHIKLHINKIHFSLSWLKQYLIRHRQTFSHSDMLVKVKVDHEHVAWQQIYNPPYVVNYDIVLKWFAIWNSCLFDLYTLFYNQCKLFEFWPDVTQNICEQSSLTWTQDSLISTELVTWPRTFTFHCNMQIRYTM